MQEVETKLPEWPPHPTIGLFFWGVETLRSNVIAKPMLGSQHT